MSPVTRDDIHTAVSAMLAAELQCNTVDFNDGDIHIVERVSTTTTSPPGRQLTNPDPYFGIAVTGPGGVVSVSSVWSNWAHQTFTHIPQHQLMGPQRMAAATRLVEESGNTLAGPYPRFVVSESDLRPTLMPKGYRLELTGPDTTRQLRSDQWPNGLERNAHENKVLVTAALARYCDSLAGLAALTKDTQRMWQIGIDVLPAHRGQGLGQALTSALAEEALAANQVPFYATSAANIPSMRTALGLGFFPGWVEVITIQNPPARARVDDPQG